jgi:hypothetical protein
MVKRKKPASRATQDPRVVPLLALQDELGLTDFQRRFVEALAVDLERNQTRAAMAAGAPRKSAAVQASKLLRLAKVQKYFRALTRTAREARAQETLAAITDLAEVLTVLTAQMRTRVGDFIVPGMNGGYVVDIEAVRNAPRGTVKELSRDGDLKFADPHSAAKTLLAYFTDKPIGSGGGNVTVGTILNELPPGVATALFRAMALASGRQQPVALLGPGEVARGLGGNDP